MRLRSLTLDRFGHFTDQSYDFGEAKDRPDFHIIYGPNEAGKTTTMEAVLRLFYGFPTREGYAFKHQRSNLQVSGLLEIDNQLRRFTRLPKRSGALLDDTGAPLPEAALAAHLGGLSETDYRNLLCLDDETIEQGGEEIAQARGDIGRLLFSAAAGVSDLSMVLEGVRDKADAIWRKRASKTRIAQLKRALAEIDKDIREGDTSASAWRGLKKAVSDARDVEFNLKQTRDALRESLQSVAAKRRALPLLLELDTLAARIAPFSDYPQQLDFDPEGLVELVARESQTKADIIRLAHEIDDMTATLATIKITPEAFDLIDQLDALDDLRSRDVTAGLDIARRRETVRETQSAMARTAADLGAAQDIDVQTLVLPQTAIARLDAAREAVQSADIAAKTEQREVAELTERWTRAKDAYDRATAACPDGQSITDILAGFDLDRLVPALTQARHAFQNAETQARETLRALGAQFDAIPPCPTSLIKAQTWAQTQIDLTRTIAQTETHLAQHLEDAAARQSQANAMTGTGTLIPDADAETLRVARDALWQAHRHSMSDDTARPFENAMNALDAAAASRVAQANELGQLRHIEQARAEAEARADQTAIRLTNLRDQGAQLQADIDRAAGAVGLSLPLLAAEWLDWVQKHGVAEQAAHTLTQLRATHQPVQERANQLLEALRPHLVGDTPDFENAIAAARTVSQAEQKHLHTADKARDIFEALDADLKRRIKKCDEKQSLKKEARDSWHAVVAELLGHALAAETLMSALTPLRDLREQDDKRADATQRVARMEQDQAQFKTLVTALAEVQNVALAETPSATFAALRNHADAARTAQRQAEDLGEKIAQARTALQEKQDILETLKQHVMAMGRVFPAGTHDNMLETLRPAVIQAQQVILDRSEHAKLELSLCSELGAANLGGVRQMLEGASAVALTAQGETLQSDLATIEDQLTGAIEARITTTQALAQVTGDDAIATLTECKATLELDLEDAALEYLELSLGHRIAQEAIRRYRDTHRSGMMAATERCFTTLTKGAYTLLITQPEGDAETLLAVDAAGTAKRAADMSKGTRFQLYLALRAAAHEQLVAQGTCLPFFCDDIFETFDENRTSAACRVMEQIGRTGQAIYLTHHRHVVEIAQKVCDTPPIVHEV
jgi:uncharacterized protein YhaN